MTTDRKTPGVYIVEKNAFPNSVVEVPTAVPAFLGYTEKAIRGAQTLRNIPTRISSLEEFATLFGESPKTKFNISNADGKLSYKADPNTRFLLYCGLRMFFQNGGGPCWIVSVGSYGDTANPTVKAGYDFDAGLLALTKEQEPTMVVVPDAVLLPQDDYIHNANMVLKHCTDLKSRITVLDVFDGDKPRTGLDDDVISGTKGFRNVIVSDDPSFGTTYYPWVHTNTVEASEIDYTNVTKEGMEILSEAIKTSITDAAAKSAVTDLLTKASDESLSANDRRLTHQSLLAVSTVYADAMSHILQEINVMPPSAAMAGVYARVDNEVGVWKAPANTSIQAVLSPTVKISGKHQEDLNVPLDGKAVNAIRSFAGRGVLIWGARTLDGNSQDWRYINVRRTLIMLEQSIFVAAQAYVFEPNTAGTWLTVQSMIENFLNNQWKAGALMGEKPSEAYDVSVGLGSTMTSQDVLDGYMHVTVRVAPTHPAEFTVITFQQKMQKS